MNHKITFAINLVKAFFIEHGLSLASFKLAVGLIFIASIAFLKGALTLVIGLPIILIGVMIGYNQQWAESTMNRIISFWFDNATI